MSLLDRLDVPDAKSRASSSATDNPRLAASRAAPAPVTPPPITSTSTTSSATRARSARRRAGDSRVRSPSMPSTVPRWATLMARVASHPWCGGRPGRVRDAAADVGLQVDDPGARDGGADGGLGRVDVAGDARGGLVLADGDLRGDQHLVGAEVHRLHVDDRRAGALERPPDLLDVLRRGG